MSERSPRSAVAAAAVVAGLLGSGVLVWQGSNAAFSDTTTNPDNNWSSGTVVLTDNRGAAMFDTAAQPIKPDDPHQRCIQVSYGGDLAAEVRLYGAAYTDDGLAADLALRIEEGSGGVFGTAECTDASGFTPTAVTGLIFDGTLAGFAVRSSFAQGVGVWAPASAGSRVYRITYELTGSDASLQGRTAAIDFVWEAQNS